MVQLKSPKNESQGLMVAWLFGWLVGWLVGWVLDWVVV